jgi:hypothetical protein
MSMTVADDDDLPSDPRTLAALIRGERRAAGDRNEPDESESDDPRVLADRILRNRRF